WRTQPPATTAPSPMTARPAAIATTVVSPPSASTICPTTTTAATARIASPRVRRVMRCDAALGRRLFGGRGGRGGCGGIGGRGGTGGGVPYAGPPVYGAPCGRGGA